MRRTLLGLVGAFAIVGCTSDRVLKPQVTADAPLLAAGGASTKPAGKVTQLVGPPATIESGATAVNDEGYVVGWTRDQPYGCAHIVLWYPDGSARDLGQCGIAMDLNNSGEIVGVLDPTSSQRYGRAFRWTADSGFTDLGSLGGTWSSAVAISESGWIVGNTSTLTGSSSSSFLYRPQFGMQDLAQITGLQVNGAFSVNSNGDVLAWTPSPPGGFVWNATTGIRYVPPLVPGGSYGGQGWKINDRGWVSGDATSANGTTHAFFWVPGSAPLDVGVLWSDAVNERSNGYGMSEDGLVVGLSITGISPGRGSAYRWTKKRGMEVLADLGGSLCYASDINRRGKIVAGWCRLPGGDTSQAVKWVLP